MVPRRPNYQANLTDLISRVRTDLFSGDQEAPFVLTRLSDNQYTSLGTGQNTVRAAQVAVAEADSFAEWIDADGDEFTTYGNPPASRPIHYDASGSLAVGSALANAFISSPGPEPEPNPLATLQFDFGTVATVNDPDASTFLNTLSGRAGAAPNDITNAIDSEGNQTTVGLAYSESNGSDSGVAGRGA